MQSLHFWQEWQAISRGMPFIVVIEVPDGLLVSTTRVATIQTDATGTRHCAR